MPSILVLCLMILGLVLLGISAFWNPQPPPERPRINIGSAGLFCWLLAEILMKTGR
jgi:hypothetical protein